MRNARMTMCLLVFCMVAVINVASADMFGTGDNQFNIDFVPISGSTNPTSGYGRVTNDYRMGTYEIGNDQWTKFKAGSDLANKVTGNYDPHFAGEGVPTNNASWYEAAQFVNYLNTSTNHTAAYKFIGTQGTSDYTLSLWQSGDVGYSVSNPYRNSNAYYFLPTEDEWVKAAYWNGTSIQTYATKAGQNITQGNGTIGTGWNYYDYYNNEYATNPIGPWDVGSSSQELNNTFDMMGNVWEWMESPYYSGDYQSGSYRSIRGGSYDGGSGGDYDLASSRRSGGNPHEEGSSVGFRVASVPEPITFFLLGLGGVMLRRK